MTLFVDDDDDVAMRINFALSNTTLDEASGFRLGGRRMYQGCDDPAWENRMHIFSRPVPLAG